MSWNKLCATCSTLDFDTPIHSNATRKFRSEGLYSPTPCDVTTQSNPTPNCFADASNKSLSTLDTIASRCRSFNAFRASTVSSKGCHRFIESANIPNSSASGRNPNRLPKPATIRDSTCL